jgi:colanic acid biosynthesis glycosyl transferase WcaI
MKILILAINFAPELTGIGKYVGEMTEWLAGQGWAVRVVTAPPYYPAWRVPPGYSAWRYRRERLPNSLVVRCPLYVPSEPSAVRRVLHLVTFALSSFPVAVWQAVTWRPDVLFVVEPPLFCAPTALVAARLGGAKAWLHVQDFELDAAFEIGTLRSTALRRAAAVLERWLMRRFQRVSTISARMLEKVVAKGVPPARGRLFPNWVDCATVRPIDSTSALRRELAIPDDVRVVLYSGSFGQKQGLELLLDVARAMQPTSSVFFLLCGEGPGRARLQEMARALPNVRFIPLQPLERLNELLNLADVHVLPQRAGAEDLVLPSKLTAMMASGRPVIATARPGSEVARAVVQGGCVVPPGDVAAFARAVLELTGDADLRRRLGQAGRQFALHSWEKARVLRHAFSPDSIVAL